MAGIYFTECDHRDCSARAYVETVLDSDGSLHWCAHHYEALAVALSPYVVDEFDHRHLWTHDLQPPRAPLPPGWVERGEL